MSPPAGWSALADRAREVSAPVVVLLSSSLLLCCLVTLPDVALGWPALSAANARLSGWAGLAVILAVASGAVSLLSSARVGSAPPLALGTTAALLGLALSQDVTSGAQAVLVLVLLAIAVGALFTSGPCVLEELSPRLASVGAIGWWSPLAGGWGAVGWLALHGRTSDETRLGLHPPALALAAAAAVLLLWAVATLILEPWRQLAVGPGPHRAGWETAWAALAVLVVAAGSMVMLVGFQPNLSPSWGRPVVLLLAAVVATGLLLCTRAIPVTSSRAAYLAVVVVAATGPACVHVLLLVSADASGALSVWVLVALTAAGVLGVGLGWRSPWVGVTAGLLLMAAAAAGGWVMPANQWVMSTAAAPMVVGVAAALAGGLRIAVGDRMRLRFVSMAGLSALLLGQLAAAPIAWALGAELTGTSARAGGRVLLGLTFAMCVVTAAVCTVLRPASPRD